MMWSPDDIRLWIVLLLVYLNVAWIVGVGFGRVFRLGRGRGEQR